VFNTNFAMNPSLFFYCFSIGSRDSVVAIATGCGLGIQVPVGTSFSFSLYRPYWFWAHPASYPNSIEEFFLGIKWPMRESDHSN
jgi:hypothetical protein